MKQTLPVETESFKPIYKMLTSQIRGYLLTAALNLKIFDALTTQKTAEEVADEINTHANNTFYFLDSLTAAGLVVKTGDRYINSELSNLFLVTSSERYVGSLFKMVKLMSIDPLMNIEELLVKGPAPQKPGEDLSSEAIWAESARSSASWAMGEAGVRIAGIISGLPGFNTFEKMLDLGGGHGFFALYITDASPKLKATVFDRAPVVAVAKEYIQKYGMEDRVNITAGDYVTDDIGDGYDLIWASATLNFVKQNPDPLISKIHGALKPGGYFISLHDGMPPDGKLPDMTIEWLSSIMTSETDYRFLRGELADAMLRCGFRSVRSRTVDMPMGALDLDIAQK